MNVVQNIDRRHDMRDDSARSLVWRLLLAAIMVVALFGLMVAVGAAQDSDRLDRKVNVMERVIDEVLVQSPNVLVSSRQVTRGIVLEGFGVLFTFDAGLHAQLPFGPGRYVVGDSEGLKFMRERDREAAEKIQRQFEEQEVLSLEEWETKSAEERAKRIEGLEVELVDTLLDYGPTLGELKDDAWVAIVAFLDGRSPFGSEGPSQMTVKVKMRDLRRFAAGNLSRQEAKATVTVATS
jgi:hypothetical protein